MRLKIAFLLGIILVAFGARAGVREWARRHQQPPEWEPSPVPAATAGVFDNPYIHKPGSPEFVEGLRKLNERQAERSDPR
jgi:hypothetical protein